MFISGFLALCSATGTGTCTEFPSGGYARQPIAFGTPKGGLTVNSTPFSFGYPGLPEQVAGRAIYDASTGGNLLLVLPFAAPRPLPGGGPVDAGDVGYIRLLFSAMAAFPDADAFTGTLAAGAISGQCYDSGDIVGTFSTAPNAASGVTLYPIGGQQLAVRASSLSTGVALTINRGTLQATSSVPA